MRTSWFILFGLWILAACNQAADSTCPTDAGKQQDLTVQNPMNQNPLNGIITLACGGISRFSGEMIWENASYLLPTSNQREDWTVLWVPVCQKNFVGDYVCTAPPKEWDFAYPQGTTCVITPCHTLTPAQIKWVDLRSNLPVVPSYTPPHLPTIDSCLDPENYGWKFLPSK